MQPYGCPESADSIAHWLANDFFKFIEPKRLLPLEENRVCVCVSVCMLGLSSVFNITVVCNSS